MTSPPAGCARAAAATVGGQAGDTSLTGLSLFLLTLISGCLCLFCWLSKYQCDFPLI
uniref:Uncharacterized protein n=1 Tax=Papilio polytes TaxID=76194 RepID=I4DN54_PAPPL|nr:unknown secreted protein [Papilio polytes]